jgi:hypothetical protein
LTVVATDEDGQISTLSQQLDLKWLLPEMVVVGISASLQSWTQLQGAARTTLIILLQAIDDFIWSIVWISLNLYF